MGEFGTNTLIADTAALKSGGGGDGVFKSTQKKLSKLLSQRDPLATELKNALFDAAFEDIGVAGLGQPARPLRVDAGPGRGARGGRVGGPAR